MPPDPALRPPFQPFNTSERMIAFPPGACVIDQPDEVQQLVMTTGQDYWDSVANGDIPADQYVIDANATADEVPPDEGDSGNGGT